MLQKSPFELHFGRKPNTEWSQALDDVVQPNTSAQGLERNFLTRTRLPARIRAVIADYSSDRAKVVPRGSASPTVASRFKPLFLLDRIVADKEPYKALAELARAANKWSQFKGNLTPDGGKLVLKEVASRHSDLAHSLMTGLNRNTLRFSNVVTNVTPPGAHVNPRRLAALQPRRPTKTSKLENLRLSDPNRDGLTSLQKSNSIKLAKTFSHIYLVTFVLLQSICVG